MSKCEHWAVLWRQSNKLDGTREHVVHDNCLPVLFRTRTEARYFIANKYGYIKTRPDLRAEPHGWKMPVPVKVKIEVGHDRGISEMGRKLDDYDTVTQSYEQVSLL